MQSVHFDILAMKRCNTIAVLDDFTLHQGVHFLKSKEFLPLGTATLQWEWLLGHNL
jgi:hypothetical protein